MFTDKLEAKDVAKMDAEYQDLLKRVLVIQADCEIGGPHLYVKDCFDAAPTDNDRLIVARTAGEEIDHFRKIVELAGELGVDATFLLKRSNTERYVEAFRGQITNWEDYATFGFLVDRVGRYQLEEYLGGTFEPLNRILPQMLQEEEGHVAHGAEQAAEMAHRDEDSRRRIQESINKWYPKALDMFGSSGSRRSERFIHWGIKRRTNEQARAEYMAEVNALIEKADLQVPDATEGRHFF